VEALLRQTSPVSTIYVIDNASREPSNAAIDDLLGAAPAVASAASRVVCTRLEANAGCPGGFAVGMRLAVDDGHDWIWLLDDDAIPADDALEKLLPHTDGGLSALASLPRLPGGKLIRTHRARCDRAKLYPGFSIPLPEEEYGPGKTPEIDLAAWAGLFVNAEAVKAVGYPMGEIFLTYCDFEYCLRLAAYGPLKLVADSLVIHHMDEGYKQRIACRGPFGTKEFTALPHLWRTFFVTRNSIWVGGRYTTRKARHYVTVLRIFLSSAKKILLYADHKKTRLRLLWAATRDGLLGRFDNSLPWKILRG